MTCGSVLDVDKGDTAFGLTHEFGYELELELKCGLWLDCEDLIAKWDVTWATCVLGLELKWLGGGVLELDGLDYLLAEDAFKHDGLLFWYVRWQVHVEVNEQKNHFTLEGAINILGINMPQ